MTTFSEVQMKVTMKRANRRRLGPFDWMSDSFDMKSSEARAWRIWQRINGVREPLIHPCSMTQAIPWNSYHY